MPICPACGEDNPPRFRLCGFCGTPLTEPAAPAEVRKTVTVLFSDLAGSTSLGERLDPEALNVAARLEQAAPPMETLLGALTHALVRDDVAAEPVEPLELKGKSEPVP